MKTLVVYDSVFGNTERVALRIGEVLGAETVKVTEVNQDQLIGLGCLVVGSPTRAFNFTKEITSFLKGIPSSSLSGVKVAAFDTRMDIEKVGNVVLSFMVRFFGFADKPIADLLKKKGGTPAVPSGGFIVEESEGPLRDGELDRAADWARAIKDSV
jgi:flavodoxin I